MLFGRQEHSALALEDVVEVVIFFALLDYVESPREDLLLKVLLKLLQLLVPDDVFVAQVRHKAHQKVELFQRDLQLCLRYEAPIHSCVDLNDLCRFFFAGGKVIASCRALSEAEEGVLFYSQRHLCVLAFDDCEMQLAPD